jgi:hypothetical protein
MLHPEGGGGGAPATLDTYTSWPNALTVAAGQIGADRSDVIRLETVEAGADQFSQYKTAGGAAPSSTDCDEPPSTTHPPRYPGPTGEGWGGQSDRHLP